MDAAPTRTEARNPLSQSKSVAASIWSPPVGWLPRAPGVWVPGEWKPTRWELQTPAIHNRAEAKADYIKCVKSLPYFIFRHCWTVDVDDPSGISIRKFPAYPFLRHFFTEVQTPCNTHVEKSRQMLMSWAWMGVFLWDVLFHRNWPALVVSKRAIDVDNGTIDSNFGKLMFMHDHLAEHLWIPFEHKRYQISVPLNHSHVRGETGKGGKASRGPTYKRALMDEAAFVDKSESVFTGLRQAAKTGTVLNSTPEGMGNTFARIRFSTTTTFKKLSYHWSLHPRKSIGLYCICGWKATPGGGSTPRQQYDAHAPICPRLQLDPPRSPEMRSPWYDRESSDMTPEKVASDLDISYQSSRRGRCYTAFDQIRNVWQVYHKIGPRRVDETIEDYTFRYLKYAIDPRLQCFTCWDIGVGDPTAILFGQILDDATPRVRFLDEIEFSDQSYKFFADHVNTVWKVAAAAIGNGITFRHYAGTDITKRESTLESWWSNLRSEGIIVERQFQGSTLEWVDYINDQGYRQGNIEISEWCKGLIDATNNYHYPVNDNGEPIPGIHLPVHDEWSHKMDAKRYLFRVRYAHRLKNRAAKGVKAKKILRRGSAYDTRTETRKF